MFAFSHHLPYYIYEASRLMLASKEEDYTMAETKKATADAKNEATARVGEGKITNTPSNQGTIQREPTAEELPSDAKIAPILEQVAPNQMSLAVGALATPSSIADVKQPEEGQKIVTEDMSDANQFLPAETDQGDDADYANEQAARDADRGKV
jgi:hypothetical protein